MSDYWQHQNPIRSPKHHKMIWLGASFWICDKCKPKQIFVEIRETKMGNKCPKCDSPAPHLHPAVQFEGEVQPCNDAFHRTITPQNTPELISPLAHIRGDKSVEDAE